MSCLQAVIHFVLTRRYVRYQTIFNDSNDELFTRQGWRSCENTRFPPMWLGLDYESRRHICGLSCWFSNLHREVFLRPFRFSPVLKNQHFNWFALIVNFILLCFSWQCPNICFRSRTTRHFIKFLSFPWLILKGFPIAFLVLLLSVLTLLLWGNQLISRTLGHFVEADLNFDKQF